MATKSDIFRKLLGDFFHADLKSETEKKSNDLGVCKSTVYNHAKKGYLSALNVDFPRIVKFKKRKGKPRSFLAKEKITI